MKSRISSISNLLLVDFRTKCIVIHFWQEQKINCVTTCMHGWRRRWKIIEWIMVKVGLNPWPLWRKNKLSMALSRTVSQHTTESYRLAVDYNGRCLLRAVSSLVLYICRNKQTSFRLIYGYSSQTTSLGSFPQVKSVNELWCQRTGNFYSSHEIAGAQNIRTTRFTSDQNVQHLLHFSTLGRYSCLRRWVARCPV